MAYLSVLNTMITNVCTSRVTTCLGNNVEPAFKRTFTRRIFQPLQITVTFGRASICPRSNISAPVGNGQSILGDGEERALTPEDYKSTIRGVKYDANKRAWLARWTKPDGQEHKKQFAVARLGFLAAKKQAEEARTAANESGVRPRASAGPAKLHSGVPGVLWHEQRHGWVAGWQDKDGKRQQRWFSAADVGIEAAKQMAIAARKEAEDSGQANTKRGKPCGVMKQPFFMAAK